MGVQEGGLLEFAVRWAFGDANRPCTRGARRAVAGRLYLSPAGLAVLFTSPAGTGGDGCAFHLVAPASSQEGFAAKRLIGDIQRGQREQLWNSASLSSKQ